MNYEESLKGEERIVWLRDPSSYPYLREYSFWSRWRTRRPSWAYHAGVLIAYSVLSKKAEPNMYGEYLRRTWWLRDYDFGMPGNPHGAKDGYNSRHGPTEAVLTCSVEAGKLSMGFPGLQLRRWR
ncbi:MAG: hypothetical protein GXP46_03975 [Deferribacteres bacterium]|nr:hypothetical protein [Deferribacteres bacterium]